MRPSQPAPRARKLTRAQLEWAQEAVKDVFLACVLNITLKNGDVCTKYLHQMNDDEGAVYFQLVHDLFDVSKKKD